MSDQMMYEVLIRLKELHAAEARVTELEAALTKIADGTILSTRFREIARAALATPTKEDTDE